MNAKKYTKTMINKRFFAYGCSFTKYAWPTWADIVGRQFSEYYNYGRPGAGNHYIFNCLMETDQIHNINKDDLVIVQWSCSSREDRYHSNSWHTPGGVANFYTDEKEFKKYFDFRGFIIRDLAMIKATKKFLDSIGCEYYFLSMVPIITNNMYADLKEFIISNENQDVADLYQDILDIFKIDFQSILGNYGDIRPLKLYGVNVIDNHPIPSEHYKYLQSVLPHLAIESNLYISSLDRELAKIYNIKNMGWSHRWPDMQHGITNIKERV
jgi:hypothetical protein